MSIAMSLSLCPSWTLLPNRMMAHLFLKIMPFLGYTQTSQKALFLKISEILFRLSHLLCWHETSLINTVAIFWALNLTPLLHLNTTLNSSIDFSWIILISKLGAAKPFQECHGMSGNSCSMHPHFCLHYNSLTNLKQAGITGSISVFSSLAQHRISQKQACGGDGAVPCASVSRGNVRPDQEGCTW